MNQPITEQSAGITLSNNMIRSIARTGPWIRFFSVLGFISVAFMLVASVFMIVMALVGGSISREPGLAFLLPMAILYLVIAIVYVFPSLFLWQAASAVVRLKHGAVAEGVEMALEKQRKFWKYIGIFTIVFVVLYPIFALTIVFFGMMG